MDIPHFLSGVHRVSGLGQLWAKMTHISDRHGSRCLKLLDSLFDFVGEWVKGDGGVLV